LNKDLVAFGGFVEDALMIIQAEENSNTPYCYFASDQVLSIVRIESYTK
jgi:hypothetical protein